MSVQKLIKASMRIEQNRENSGSEMAQVMKQHSTIPAAKVEERDEVSGLTFVSPLCYKLILNLDEIPVTQDMIKSMDKRLRVTKGLFMIKYVPKTDKTYVKGRPFKIGQDLIRMRVRVSCVEHWFYLCDKIPEFNWIRNNCMYNTKDRMKQMFDLAAQHPGMTFWFTIDWAAYAEKIRKNAEAQSLEETDHVLGAYKCSRQDYIERGYEGKTATVRELQDVLKEVQEVEMKPEIQKAMLEATGEAAITHENYIKGHGGNHTPRDPKTGRFISPIYNKDKEDEK